MHGILTRQSDPKDLALRVVRHSDRHFNIENNYVKLADFDREYVCFGGYAGSHNPALFAAAPGLLEALQACAGVLSHHGIAPATLQRALAAIAKATGAAA